MRQILKILPMLGTKTDCVVVSIDRDASFFRVYYKDGTSADFPSRAAACRIDTKDERKNDANT